MLIRPKIFLTCLALCLTPLLLLAGFNYWSGARIAQASVGRELQSDLSQFVEKVDYVLDTQEASLLSLTRAESMRAYADALRRTPKSDSEATLPSELRAQLASILNRRHRFSSIAYFDQSRRQVFLAELKSEGLVVRNKHFLPGQLQPDERAWQSSATEVLSSVSRNSLESNLIITTPVIVDGSESPIGAVVGELSLDAILSEADQGLRGKDSSPRSFDRDKNQTIAIDNSGTIVYHSNQALHHQPISKLPLELAPLTRRMMSGESGAQIFEAGGNPLAAAHTVIAPLNLSVAVIDEYPEALFLARRAGFAGVILAIVLGLVAAFLLARFWEKRTSGFERVTRGVAAIAGGDLSHRIEARSSDAIRPLSDDLNSMTAQLREQIARETEARQFQAFVRLSAMLTHDLKNAIEALSLIVSNMERHFDNEAFRADAMKSLNLATGNLRSLVDRLTNPVNTLSGEYKRPRPVDLVPVLNRVVSLTAAQVSGTHQIETKLPASVVALADETRIQKVMENLVLNGLEAIAGKGGKLTIEAGPAEAGTVFFSVSDTGVGMNAAFVENQLYRPFATTKKRGVGLGLYTCREFVRANGGTIEVDSREDAGTTFRVVLPSASIEQAD